MRKILLLALLCIFSFTTAAQTKPSEKTSIDKPGIEKSIAKKLTEHQSSPEVRQQTFEQVWTTVKEKHFDPTFGGVDWDKVRTQYEPRVATVKSDEELYQLLQQMLRELHQSHFNIIPPDEIVTDDEGKPALGSIGVDIRSIDNQAVITQIDPNSAAARAGLHTGFVITKIDDLSIEEFRTRFGKDKELTPLKRLYFSRAVLSYIEGTPQTTVHINYLDNKNQPLEATIEREKLKGELAPSFGNLPATYVEFESKRLINNIGYIRFNIFLIPVMEKIRTAIRAMSDAPGIIIDLRGNPGGLGGMSSGIAGMLTDKDIKLGAMTMRNGYLNFIGYPQQGAFLGPVVILVDGNSASTSEVFAGGMQEAGRAVIVGERSAGAALPSLIEKLPTGALFQYATADFKTPNGVLLEGRGVQPNVEVKLARKLLSESSDPQLDAATEQIKKMNSQKTASSTEK